MGYYDLSSEKRKTLYLEMEKNILEELSSGAVDKIKDYASDRDTYIRKNCYLILGRLYSGEAELKRKVLKAIDSLSVSNDEKVRQTAVYALGEIGKKDFGAIENKLDLFLADTHHSVKNGLTGALKQMGEKNPEPTLYWVKDKLMDCNADMKGRILHGLELRGRNHPEDLFPIIKEIMSGDVNKKLKKMIVHIIGQISYKKGCLEKVAADLKMWGDETFLAECRKEIIEVHRNYGKFSFYSPEEAEDYLAAHLGPSQ